jgi:hypothetical protein
MFHVWFYMALQGAQKLAANAEAFDTLAEASGIKMRLDDTKN